MGSDKSSSDQSGESSIIHNDSERGEYPIQEGRKNDSEVHGMMEDNAMRIATETQEDDNGGAVEMRDNGNVRQGQR